MAKYHIEEMCVCIVAQYCINNKLQSEYYVHQPPPEMLKKFKEWLGFDVVRIYCRLCPDEENCGGVIFCPAGYPPDPSYGIKWLFEKKGGKFEVWAN